MRPCEGEVRGHLQINKTLRGDEEPARHLTVARRLHVHVDLKAYRNRFICEIKKVFKKWD